MPERLTMEGLHIHAHERALVQGVDLALEPGVITVLVGASGSGKSLTARALLGMVKAEPGVSAGVLTVETGSETLRPYSDGRWDRIRGPLVSWLPQDARGALDPLWTVGRQLREALTLARRDPDPVPWLSRAGLDDAPRAARLFPHELSGGMAQRASIALALARGSRYLLADEPTTGLDPTVQEGILDELVGLKHEGVGILLITHDLRLVPRLGDRLLVMAEGRMVEDLPARELHRVSAPEALQLLEATRRVGGGLL